MTATARPTRRAPFVLAALAVLLVLPTVASAAPGEPASRRYRTGRARPRATLIFLHGLGGSPQSLMASRLAHAFDRRGDSYHIVVPWLRPVQRHGEQLVDAGPHTMSDQLARIHAAIEHAEGPVVLVGHSFGAKGALKLAKHCPDKVKCIVTMAPSVSMLYAYWKRLTGERGLPHDRARIEQRLRQRREQLDHALRQARRAGNHLQSQGLEAELNYLATMEDLAKHHDEHGIETNLRQPLLAIHGVEDRSVSIHYVRRFANDPSNTGVQLVEVPGADHQFDVLRHGRLDRLATDQVSDQLAQQISTFIDQQLRAAGGGGQ